jgi:signal transduction histidine kinase
MIPIRQSRGFRASALLLALTGLGIVAIGLSYSVKIQHDAGLNASLSREAMAALLAQLRLSYLLIALIVLLAGAGFAAFWRMRWSGPLRELAQKFDSVRAGRFDVASGIRRDDELGALAQAFDAMVATLQTDIATLEKTAEERAGQLSDAQKVMLEEARLAGMAALATDVLHNVGNILTSVVISGELIQESVEKSTLHKLKKANALLREKMGDLTGFIATDPRGRMLLEYYLELEDAFSQEHQLMQSHVKRLNERIGAIREVVVAQQHYAAYGTFMDEYVLEEIIEDALKIQESSLGKQGISVEKRFSGATRVFVQKGKFLHVLVNLIKNAKEAMDEVAPEKRKLIVEVEQNDRFAFIRIIDSGSGIDPANLTKIFSHGFTTKKRGFGFGLHSSANYMREMGGDIAVHSAGNGSGTVFTVSIPKGPAAR